MPAAPPSTHRIGGEAGLPPLHGGAQDVGGRLNGASRRPTRRVRREMAATAPRDHFAPALARRPGYVRSERLGLRNRRPVPFEKCTKKLSTPNQGFTSRSSTPRISEKRTTSSSNA